MNLPTLRFGLEDARQASEAWNFNCGPGALCAVLSMTPSELRPHLLDFEQKGYTNPTLMSGILRKLNVPFRQVFRSDVPGQTFPEPDLGLMRVQWDGRWTQPGVPMAARYRKTHWVAVARTYVFDVNTVNEGWITWRAWSLEIVPWLIKQCCPEGNGKWWPTHILEIRNKKVTS